MPGKAVGRAAVELPWLCPKTDSLIALADNPASVTALLCGDPSLELFLSRFAQFNPEPSLGCLAPGTLNSALLPDTASAFLSATSSGVIPWDSSIVEKLLKVTRRAGDIAALLAETTRRCTADSVATAARLAPLGWLAVAAADRFTAGDPLSDPQFRSQPAKIQSDLWGLDNAALSRRLAERWRLPIWISSTIGSLNYSLPIAARLVANLDVFSIVQLAVLEAEREGTFFGLTVGSSRADLLEHLGLDDSALERIVTRSDDIVHRPSRSALDPNPHRVPLVSNLLRMAAQSRRRNGPSLVARLEDRIDGLHTVLADLGELVGERLQAAKLDGLAELAAGAGHEINNPLAVISGNAQRLLRTEPDIERGDSLRAIVRQAHRIAGILRDLMQFARPPRPSTRVFPLAELLQGARDDLASSALEKEVRLELHGVFAGLWVEGDLTQLRHALGAVIRNGIEATTEHGWVRILCNQADEGSFKIIVEDNGPGLSREIAEHAFDPFFCGRSAGRGRGLGLPTAWQLVRQNGGELRYERVDGQPTRFVLTLNKGDVNPDVLPLRSA